jgi:anaerobic ribonucleoside-triphosphate reductase activating protein
VSARIKINKVHFPVTSLGYGKRLGIWVQGCSIQCPGCISRDTWDFRDDMVIDVERFIASIEHWLIKADGVTISGGEPFDQPGALAELLEKLRRHQSGDILVYSGYSRERLLAQHATILKQIDILISEPYRPEAGTALMLRGSDNQRITLLSPLARARYPQDIDRRAWDPARKLDVMMDGDTVWMAGIPRAGEMARLKRDLASSGLHCGSSDQANFLIRA